VTEPYGIDDKITRQAVFGGGAGLVVLLVNAITLRITVVPSMLTPGGVHSEIEIPEALAALRTRFPDVELRYAWPFDAAAVADLLALQIRGRAE